MVLANLSGGGLNVAAALRGKLQAMSGCQQQIGHRMVHWT